MRLGRKLRREEDEMNKGKERLEGAEERIDGEGEDEEELDGEEGEL